MRKLFTHSIKAILLLLVTLAFVQVNAQRRYSPLAASDFELTIQNDVQLTNTTMQFDLFIRDTDPSQPFELAAVQAGILINKSISTAPTTQLSVSINPNSSDFVAAMVPTSVQIADGGTTQMIIKLASKIQPPCGQGTILSTTGIGMRICTIKVTSTAAFVANSQPALAFCFTTVPYPTKVFQRINCVGTELTCNSSNCLPGTYYTNPFLNPSPTAYPTLLNMSPTTNICNTTGTIGVSGATQATVTYTLYKDGVAQTPEIVGTGAAISWPGQTGSANGTLYKVKARVTATPTLTRWMTGNILISTVPVITFNALTDACEGGAAIPLVATPTVGTFSGTGVTFVPNTLSYTFDPVAAGVGGPYTITYTYSNFGGCAATPVSHDINVNALPVITFDPPVGNVCVGATVTLTATPAGGTFSGTYVTGNQFHPTAAGTVNITYNYTDPSTGCVAVPVTQPYPVVVCAVPPTVVTNAATSISYNSATLNGSVNANGTSTVVTFQWGLTTAYTGGTITAPQSPVTGGTDTPVTGALSGLAAGTTYHFRAVGVSSGGTTLGNDMTFTTTTPTLSTVVTTAATGITQTAATLNGTVNANNTPTTVSFEYGLTASYGSTQPATPATVTGSTVTPVLFNATGLLPNTTYHFRCVGVNAAGTTNGNDMTFTTLAIPVPTVTTTAATAIATTTATLNGTVNANGFSTTVTFEYGLTTAYGTPAAGTPSPVTGSTTTSVSANITGLLPNTTYHFRCVGVNGGGTTNGNDMVFTTSNVLAPTVVTNAATNLGANGTTATLNGTVTANNGNTTVTFQYGLTTAYGSNVNATPATVTGNTATPVLANITGLTGNTTYHFRCVGVNSMGTTNGNDMTFTTPCPPAGQAGPITGPTQVCQGGTGYVYTVTIPNATGYVWTVPSGGTITSGANTNSITVSFSPTAVSGYVFVYGTSLCGNGAPSQLGVAMNAPANPVLTGPSSVCVNTPGNVYATQAGMSNYSWNVSAGGLVTAGGGSTNNTVTVTWQTTGAKTVSVNYNNANGCPALTPTVYNVTVNAQPVPTITGPATACSNYPTVYTTESGMTGYNWNISAGGTIAGQGTNSITATWSTTGAHSVSVNYVNASGCTASAPVTKNVTVNAGAAPTITGPTSVCVNSGYITYTTQSGMTGYTWTVSPGGVISFGAGTNSILVTWNSGGAQWVKVSYTNANGCSPASPTQLNVTVTPIPDPAGQITGTHEICGGATGVQYSVAPIANASSYVWNLPAGATIASGTGTNTILVDFAPNATPGNITVYGNNVCGNGLASPPFTLSLLPIPGAAGLITGPAAVCKPSFGVAYSVAEILGATNYVWAIPTGAVIASGANTNSITVDFPADAQTGVINVYGANDCGEGAPSPDVNITYTEPPVAPVITLDGYTLTSNVADGNQWYFEGQPLIDATGQTYDASVNHSGIYWDVVTVGGCVSDTSNHIYVLIEGVNDLNGASFSVYPIPNNGHFTISIVSPSQETYNLTIYNNIGMKVYEANNILVKGTAEKVIDLKSAAQGVYSVVLQNGKNKADKKILINK